MIFKEKKQYKIALDRATPCVEWIGLLKMDSPVFRESEWQLLACYQKYKIHYPGLELFVDARIVGNVSTEDTTWVVKMILPELARLGMTKEAFLVPESALERIIVKNFISKASNTIEMKLFSTQYSAKEWLKNKNT